MSVDPCSPRNEYLLSATISEEKTSSSHDEEHTSLLAFTNPGLNSPSLQIAVNPKSRLAFTVLLNQERTIVRLDQHSLMNCLNIRNERLLDTKHLVDLISKRYFHWNQDLQDAGQNEISYPIGSWVKLQQASQQIGVFARELKCALRNKKLKSLISEKIADLKLLKSLERTSQKTIYEKDFLVVKLNQTQLDSCILERTYNLSISRGKRAAKKVQSMLEKNGVIRCLQVREYKNEKHQLMVKMVHLVQKKEPTELDLLITDLQEFKAHCSEAHFSAKDWGLQRSVYVDGDKLFFGLKSTLIGQGCFATIKWAEDERGDRWVRRIFQQEPWNRGELGLQTVIDNQGQPGIIPLLGKVAYESATYKEKLVTFHPFIEKTLTTALDEGIDPQFHRSLSLQLVNALRAIQGAHGDLKPGNVLTKLGDLWLIDFDMYKPNKAAAVCFSGTAQWLPPEALKGKPVIWEKFDVWPAGIMFYMLFAQIREGFAWQYAANNQERCQMMGSQEEIDQKIDQTNIAPELKTLLKNMIVLDVEKRWTISQVAEYLNKYYSDEK